MRLSGEGGFAYGDPLGWGIHLISGEVATTFEPFLGRFMCDNVIY